VREVVLTRVPPVSDHGLSACVRNVADSPTAVRRLLRFLTTEHVNAVATSLPWEPARKELVRLLGEIRLIEARRAPRRWP
jgi:hypothetical protein